MINQEMCKSQSVNKNNSFEALLSGVDVTSEIRTDDIEEEGEEEEEKKSLFHGQRTELTLKQLSVVDLTREGR